ncbi:hypothetical protein CVT25_013193 [Psilocybe cyanescens]|uniref:Peptidase M3A/M3B catalytic domain-containing protein n=1 Tax=Psilocybe cyanescens TaxID=93625 RepID=A0A409XLL4_PSICY|nr:hypothetical protein CVT25_013193 [Psilocybe cyanescens]
MISPPQLPLTWEHTVKDLIDQTDAAITRLKSALNRVGSLKPEECNFQSVFVFLESEESLYNSTIETLAFYQNVSGSQELRDESSAADSRSRDFKVESSMRMDVFNAKIAAERNIKESGKWDALEAEERRLVEKMILDGRRAGLALPPQKQEELKTLKKELSQVSLDYMKNFNEENGAISFTKEELKGVPEDVISGYRKRTVTDNAGETELYDVTFKGPDFSPVLSYAESPETRKRTKEAHDSRLSVNVPIIAKAFELRRKKALLLGYNNWADYVTDDRMIKSGKAIEEFLDDLIKKLLPIGLKERENLLALKQADYASQGLPFDGKFYLWDDGYYGRKFTEQTLQIDSKLVKENFPVERVVPTVLGMYQDMFGVRFMEREGASVWHPDVQAYAVWEKDAVDETGFIGYTYLDLYPRSGKFSHIAVWPLIPGHELPNGKRSYPINTMVANLAKPTPDTPALMRHHDVVMFFHEMGHVFHDLLSRTRFARFHGTSGTLDFVEAPSQMLENWCWEPKILAKISSHYITGEPIPMELAENLKKSRQLNRGSFYLQQMFYAKYDFKVHYDCDQLETPEAYTSLWCTLRKETLLSDHDKECPGQAAFSHLASGYDVGYYGYSYSQVFAADMYATIFEEDPLDPARAKLYRDKVLVPGASRDELDILKDFLGRSPNSDAFSRQLFGAGL